MLEEPMAAAAISDNLKDRAAATFAAPRAGHLAHPESTTGKIA
jgi:hypothetical protein